MGNYSGQSEAECSITFAAPGIYTVSVVYRSTDTNYVDASGPHATVEVTG